MNEIKRIFEQEEIRIITKGTELYFVVRDVCSILGIKNASDAIKLLEKDDLDSIEVMDSIGRTQKTYIVNEEGLYDLIMRSRKDEAKAFRRWVTHEVLPSIRKTGQYKISDSLKNKSTKTRNMLTDEWQKNGVKERWQYGKLTLEEYKLLQFDKGKRKKDFNDGELKTLLALEAMEMLSLHYNPVEGFIECKKNMTSTAQKVLEIKEK